MPIRYNIRWLQLRRPEKFDLYILGLKRFYAQDASLLTSYYQIAGIHGLPGLGTGRVDVTVWPDWPTGNGYCPHSSIIFGPWHRPYLALYEVRPSCCYSRCLRFRWYCPHQHTNTIRCSKPYTISSRTLPKSFPRASYVTDMLRPRRTFASRTLTGRLGRRRKKISYSRQSSRGLQSLWPMWMASAKRWTTPCTTTSSPRIGDRSSARYVVPCAFRMLEIPP